MADVIAFTGRSFEGITNGPGPGVSDATTAAVLSVFPQAPGAIVSAPSPVMTALRLTWQKVDTLWGGTESMRLAGQRMLPKEPYEEDDDYQQRLQRSVLVNYYKNTIQDAAGRVFAKDVELLSAASLMTDKTTVKMPAQPVMQAFAVDVDAQGNNVTQFSKQVFEQAINHGVSYILVDYPKTPNEDLTTLEQQVESGARPYWVHVPAPQVLDYKSAMIGGKERCTLFRYEEVVHELSSDGFSSTGYQQVRIYKHDKDSVPVFATYRRELGNSGNWQLVGVGVLTDANGQPLPAIPVAVVYTNKVGYGLGKPALEDLADLNIAHWQSYSDYRNITHVANVPFLFGKGLQSELDKDGRVKPMILSVRKAMTTNSETADIKWVEHTGQSIESARKALADMVDMMKEIGLKLRQDVAPNGRTATEVVANVAESNSRLKSFALSLNDALNVALFYTAQFLGIPDMTRAKVCTDFADIVTNTQDLQWILQAFDSGAIDAETVVSEMKRHNVIDPNAEVEIPEQIDAPTDTQSTTNTPDQPSTEDNLVQEDA
jgi:hypothetical protein